MVDDTSIGRPFQGKAWFWVETSYSGGSAGSAFKPSDLILDARLDTGEMHNPKRGIHSSAVSAFLSQPSDPVFHLEWISQATAHSLATNCITRDSGDDLNSLAFCFGTSTASSNPAYFYLTGCKAKNINLAASGGPGDNEYIWTADFSVQSVTSSTAATGTEPVKIGTAFAQFNRAGTIYKDTNHDIAFITNTINITIENNLKDYWDHDSQAKVAAIPGAIDITGSCDISLDDGGRTQWGHVYNREELTNIKIDTGATGNDNDILLSHVDWDNTSIDANLSGEGMMHSQPFTARHIDIS